MLERGFLIFWIFFLFFFWNFLAGVQYEWNWGIKFFSPFLGLSHPVLAKNSAGNRFFNILNFFAIFFGIFLTASSMNGIQNKIFFLFLIISHPVLARYNARKKFFNFLIFLLFFSEVSCRGPIWAKFGPKIFFSLSWPISSRFGLKYCLNEVF